MDYHLDDKTALVTGGAGRVGSTDCKILADEGAEVLVLDIRKEEAERVAAEIRDGGGCAVAIGCDITDRSDVRNSVSEIREISGGVDILVNNAAVVDEKRNNLSDNSHERWLQNINTNLTGADNVTRELFSDMCDRGWGRIINMSSMSARGSYGRISYSSTKAGIIGFSKTLALEGARYGVTSNAIMPNVVVKELSQMDSEELAQVDERLARILRNTPMRTFGTEEDVANLVAYLSSELSGYLTGQVIGVTGGVGLFEPNTQT